MRWPTSIAGLSDTQMLLATLRPDSWTAVTEDLVVGGVFVCFGRGGTGPGAAGDAGWAGAAVMRDGRITERVSVSGTAGGGYRAGYLALRDGPLLEKAVLALQELPGVLLVDATGRDHPRRAGLALHLGAMLGIPTVGVTHRPLLAAGEWPRSDARGATSRLTLENEVVGTWLRTQTGRRPLAVHGAWRTSPAAACSVILATTFDYRTPEPLREARRLARTARSNTGGDPNGPRTVTSGGPGSSES